MINITSKWSITAIILWAILIPDNKSIYTTADNDVSSYSGTTPRTEYALGETSTTENIHKNLDLEILPALTEYTLTSNSSDTDRNFTCKGNKPVQWYFKQYDDNIFKVKSLLAEEFSIDRNISTYLSIFSLNNVTYLDTGRYYCAPQEIEPNLIEKFANSSIYIFIQDDTHLIASPNDFDRWFPTGDDNSYTLIPCRPTSPDVNAQLFYGDVYMANITGDSYYDKYTGFIYKEPSQYFFSVFICITKRNGIVEKRNFIGSTKDVVTIKDKYTEQSFVKRNLTLTCSINPSKYIDYELYGLSWFISKQLNNQPDRVQFDAEKMIRSPDDLIQLNIQNVTFEDNSKIICRLFYWDSTQIRRVYDHIYNLQIIPPSGNYLKFNVLNDNDIIMHPVGYHRVKWTIQVLSIPNAILEWIGPNNKKLDAISEKTRINTFNGSSELVIRNLEVSDSGVYRLSASNTYEKKEINFTLFVEDIQISPHVAEHILSINSTEADRTLTCKSNKPVQWYFQDYDGNLIQKKSNLTNFSKDQKNYIYVSLLSLSKVTYIDTGYYYCAPMSVEKKSIKDFKNIYVLVQG